MIIVKSPREIVLMREAGRIVAEVFNALEPLIKPGVTTMRLNDVADKIIRDHGAIPSFKGYQGFPASICASVNDTLVHGIPNDLPLKEGDIISIDIGAEYKGYHGDAARTYPVGKVSKSAEKLIEITKQSFFEAIKLIKPGLCLTDICHTIQTFCEKAGYSLPEDYTGHGIGSQLHEAPAIPNYGEPGHGPLLKKGMCLAIEPMVHQGKKDTKVMNDGWTVKTLDGSLASHYENTIVITEDGCEILTILSKGEQD